MFSIEGCSDGKQMGSCECFELFVLAENPRCVMLWSFSSADSREVEQRISCNLISGTCRATCYMPDVSIRASVSRSRRPSTVSSRMLLWSLVGASRVSVMTCKHLCRPPCSGESTTSCHKRDGDVFWYSIQEPLGPCAARAQRRCGPTGCCADQPLVIS